jgi:predicted enzyme related to lactoylglutathione lyase
MRTTHSAGSPNWFELATTDQAGAERFYGALFGWTIERSPTGEGGEYTLFKLDGRDVAAAWTLPPEQAAQGVSPHWAVYFRVDDAETVAARAAASGGAVLAPAFEVMDHLRMAVCADPDQAAFSLFEPRAHGGVAAIREPNAVCWVELAARDIARAEAFYVGLFGWTMQDHEGSPTAYRMFGNADGMLGGLLQMTEEWGEMPSHWSIYLQVEDVDAAVAKAQALGGKLCFPAFDAPGVGRLARIDDPSGAGFYVIRFVDDIDG